MGGIVEPNNKMSSDIDELKSKLTFGQAIVFAKNGQLITREGWNGKGMFIFLRPSDIINAETIIDRIKSVPESVKNYYRATAEPTDEVKFTEYFCMKAANSTIVNGWLASQTDMLATDWKLFEY